MRVEMHSLVHLDALDVDGSVELAVGLEVDLGVRRIQGAPDHGPVVDSGIPRRPPFTKDVGVPAAQEQGLLPVLGLKTEKPGGPYSWLPGSQSYSTTRWP